MMRDARVKVLALLLPLLCLAAPALAQQSERFGPYELYYAVVNTTLLDPRAMAANGIVRGADRAIINLALREHLPEGGTVARAMLIKGRTWDLLQQGAELEFREVRENPAVYYIAEFRFINEEWRFFEVHFRPEGAGKTYTFKLKHQMYRDLE